MSIINIKEKLKQWLFADELNEINTKLDYLTKDYSLLKESTETARKKYREAEQKCNSAKQEIKKCKEFMNQICDVGVDVGFKDEYHSWAVVCIHGRMDFIKFVPLNQQDIRYVQQFLKQFEYSKKVVDSPLGHRMLEDMILNWE